MKYTQSKDGQYRCTMWFRERFTMDELADFNMRAREMGYKDIRDYFQIKMGNIWIMFEDDWHDEVGPLEENDMC